MNQNDVNNAVDYLYTHGKKYAAAKGRRVQLEEYRKSLKAMCMKKALADKRATSAAAAEMDTLEGAQRRLNSAYEEMATQLGDAAAPMLTQFLNIAENLLTGLLMLFINMW